MTGANTDRVEIPSYQAAVSALLRIASILFADAAAVMQKGEAVGDPTFRAWLDCQETAQAFTTRQHTTVVPEDQKRIDSAFEIARQIVIREGLVLPEMVARARESNFNIEVLRFQLACYEDREGAAA